MSAPNQSLLTNRDLEHLSSIGISSEEAEWQLGRLADPPPPARLLRPATVGDGIERLETDRQAELERLFLGAGWSTLKFVPASGAASRMFKELLSEWRNETYDATDSAGRRLVDGAGRWPFTDWPAPEGGESALAGALRHVLSTDALALPELPKGLLPFHRRRDAPSATAFEEQLREGVLHLRSAEGTCRFHFTVSGQHEARFRAELERLRPSLEAELGTSLDVSFSQQSSATDTLAISTDGELIRDSEGRPLLRPGGHGALLSNLAQLHADCVFVKNIDNIQPPHRQIEVARWKRILGGRLAELTSASHRLANDLERSLAGSGDRVGAVARAQAFLSQNFGLPDHLAQGDPEAVDARELLQRLDRPLRVCGVVANTGEPGGGPFWTNPEDPSLQIVESAEIADDQIELLHAGSHFNPVDLALCLRDRHGTPHDLPTFVDQDRVFVAKKSAGGRDLLALERPGLWNGAMARWNTVFVEVPMETFAPVKTLFDLLKPQHQPED